MNKKGIVIRKKKKDNTRKMSKKETQEVTVYETLKGTGQNKVNKMNK